MSWQESGGGAGKRPWASGGGGNSTWGKSSETGGRESWKSREGGWSSGGRSGGSWDKSGNGSSWGGQGGGGGDWKRPRTENGKSEASKESLDADLDNYFGKAKTGEVKEKEELDQQLDTYFSKGKRKEFYEGENPKDRAMSAAADYTAGSREALDAELDGYFSKGKEDWCESVDPASALFLGLDIATEACKAVVINPQLEVVHDACVQFDTDLPHYGTKDGVQRGEAGHVTASPLMWVESVELVLQRLREAECPLERVRAISGSGHQHASVYWSGKAKSALRGLDPKKVLVDQLRSAFASYKSPTWMDSSAIESSRCMEQQMGGASEISKRTGSRSHERCAAHHIRDFTTDDKFNECNRISLASSFGASLLLGSFANIDVSDGASMNLMDITKKAWDDELLTKCVAHGDAQVADRIRVQLGALSEPWEIAGKLHSFYSEKFGFAGDTDVVHWSGDKVCSCVGLGLCKPRDIVVSLGTCDMCCVALETAPTEPMPFGHLLPHPLPPRGMYLAMLFYANGDVTRRKTCELNADGQWDLFSEHVQKTSPGIGNQCGIFLDTDEITPPLTKGDPIRGKSGMGTNAEIVDAFADPVEDCRAVLEQRALAMRSHLAQISPAVFKPAAKDDGAAPRLYLTGGDSVSTVIRQIFADVFARTVVYLDGNESAARGAAVRAWCSHTSAAAGVSELRETLSPKGEVVEPVQSAVEVYTGLLPVYQAIEQLAKEMRAST